MKRSTPARLEAPIPAIVRRGLRTTHIGNREDNKKGLSLGQLVMAKTKLAPSYYRHISFFHLVFSSQSYRKAYTVLSYLQWLYLYT